MAFRSRVPRPNPPRHVLPVPRFSSLSPHPRNCPPFLVQRPTRIIVVAAVYIYIYIQRERESLPFYLFSQSFSFLLLHPFFSIFLPFSLPSLSRSLCSIQGRRFESRRRIFIFLFLSIFPTSLLPCPSVLSPFLSLSPFLRPSLFIRLSHSLQALCLCLSHRHSRFPALSKINTSQRGLKTCVNMVLHCLYVHITLSARLLPPTRKPAGHFTTPYRRGQVREAERIARGSNTAARRGQTMFDKAAYILARITVRHPTARATMLY